MPSAGCKRRNRNARYLLTYLNQDETIRNKVKLFKVKLVKVKLLKSKLLRVKILQIKLPKVNLMKVKNQSYPMIFLVRKS